jgi:hypothetical protein
LTHFPANFLPNLLGSNECVGCGQGSKTLHNSIFIQELLTEDQRFNLK